MNSCVIYARFSSYGQNEQSIDGQVRICKEYAESKGLEVIKVYEEKARTGTNDSRPRFQEMISDAKTGSFQYIIVYMFDRFARNRRDSIVYKEMLKDKYNIKVLSALEPIADDEGGEFYEMFLEWNAEKYSKRLSKRVKDGIDTSVANGTFCGGHLIYGYKLLLEPIPNKPNKFIKRVIVDEEAAKVVKYVFEQYAKGETKKEIAETLNSQGFRLNGKRVTGKSFDKWLVNRKYTGCFSFGGRVCDNMFPEIVSNEIFEKVQKRLEANRYFAGGVAKARVPYLLTGKLYCGHCGTEMVADGGTSKTGKQHHYYSCKKMRRKQCNKRREEKDMLERYVVDCVINFLSDEHNSKIIADNVVNFYDKRTDEANIKSVTAKIANINKEVEKLTEAFIEAKTELIRKNIDKKVQEYETLLNDLETQKSILEIERGYKLTKKDILTFISELISENREDKDFQKKIIDRLVDKVFVSDTNTLVSMNVSGGKIDEEILFSDVKDILDNPKGVQMRLPFARHKRG